MASPVISVSNLVKRFGPVVAVDDVSFAIRGGQIVGLLGANGAGKTTTISILLGLVTPTSGRVTVLGSDMTRNRTEALARMNFSSPYVDLPKRLSVRENLRVYAELYGVRNAPGRISRLAEELQIVAFMKRPFGQLSSGQRTRVSLAKSLLNEPEVLLLDEPTASLDPETANWIREYLTEYCRSRGATILLASHNMVEVERLCADVMVMQAGRIVDSGPPDALIARHGRGTLEDAFLKIVRAPLGVPG